MKAEVIPIDSKPRKKPSEPSISKVVLINGTEDREQVLNVLSFLLKRAEQIEQEGSALKRAA
jgi:RNA binding exosome subunit